jgi:hypothetical protein
MSKFQKTITLCIKRIFLGPHHVSHPNSQILSPIHIGGYAALDLGVLPEQGQGSNGQIALRRLPMVHCRHRAKVQLLCGSD